MKNLVRCGLIRLLGIAALAVPIGCDDPAPTDPQGSAAVSGSVTRVKTATAVPNAIIALLRGGEIVQTSFTDAAGNFAFEGIPAGEYSARITGLELTGLDLRFVSFAPVEVPLTVGNEPVELFFAGNGLVAPHVVGDVFCDGVPVEGVDIRVVGGDFDRRVETNAQGRYSATNLSAGHYTVLLLDHGSVCSFETTYGVVELLPGQGTTLDFVGR